MIVANIFQLKSLQIYWWDVYDLISVKRNLIFEALFNLIFRYADYIYFPFVCSKN